MGIFLILFLIIIAITLILLASIEIKKYIKQEEQEKQDSILRPYIKPAILSPNVGSDIALVHKSLSKSIGVIEFSCSENSPK